MPNDDGDDEVIIISRRNSTDEERQRAILKIAAGSSRLTDADRAEIKVFEPAFASASSPPLNMIQKWQLRWLIGKAVVDE